MNIGNWQFEARGEIKLLNDQLVWTAYDGCDISEPCVYIWQLHRQLHNMTTEIAYVGKAGYGLDNRMRQHINGFRYANRKKAAILEDLQGGGVYKVFASRSDTLLHKIGIEVSTYSWDEHAVYAWCLRNAAGSLRLNLAGFPGTQPPPQRSYDPEEQVDEGFVDEAGVEEGIAPNPSLNSNTSLIKDLNIAAQQNGMENCGCWRTIQRYSGMHNNQTPPGISNCQWDVLARFQDRVAVRNTWVFRVPSIADAGNWILVPAPAVNGGANINFPQPVNGCGYYVPIAQLLNPGVIDWAKMHKRICG